MCSVLSRIPSTRVKDEMLAQFVVGSHLRSHPSFDADQDEVNVSTSVDADVSC